MCLGYRDVLEGTAVRYMYAREARGALEGTGVC